MSIEKENTKSRKTILIMIAIMVVIVLLLIGFLLLSDDDKPDPPVTPGPPVTSDPPFTPDPPVTAPETFMYNNKPSYFQGGNNGTASCNRFCEAKQVPEGRNWHNKPLPDGWKRAQCAGVGLKTDINTIGDSYTCDDVRGLNVDQEQTCLCTEAPETFI
jgi:hypothetical protein